MRQAVLGLRAVRWTGGAEGEHGDSAGTPLPTFFVS